MELKRKVMEELLQWADDSARKSLLLIGARQSGKTYIVKKFANQCGRKSIYINFEANPEFIDAFNGALIPDAIIDKIRWHPNFINFDFRVSSAPILIILDEIQACPKAITALKFFSESKNYDVIGTGSLLGVALQHVSSYPVGYVDEIKMFPLDFEEFLWANSISDTEQLSSLIKSGESIPQYAHEEYMRLFKQFVIIGGLPEVVTEFINGKPYNEILKLQRKILEAYKKDIAKYAPNEIKEKTKECFDSIPFQLAKDNKKFQYKHVSSGGRASQYDTSLNWIIDAGLAYKSHCLSNLEQPLKAYQIPNKFKLYFFDTGLLISMLDDSTASKIMNDDLKIYKGAIYENVVACILNSQSLSLFYFEKDSRREIDFILSLFDSIIPLEVKANDNLNSKSLNALLSDNRISFSIKVSQVNQHIIDNKSLHLIPFYLLPFIKQLVKVEYPF